MRAPLCACCTFFSAPPVPTALDKFRSVAKNVMPAAEEPSGADKFAALAQQVMLKEKIIFTCKAREEAHVRKLRCA